MISALSIYRRPIPAANASMIMYLATMAGTFALGAATSAFGLFGTLKGLIAGGQ